MKKKSICAIGIICILSLTGCASAVVSTDNEQIPCSSGNCTDSQNRDSVPDSSASLDTSKVGTRDNTPTVLIPDASGTNTLTCKVATVDISNASDGYIMVKYTGTSNKVKLLLVCPSPSDPKSTTQYTYTLTPGADYETFPLTSSGTYTVSVCENVKGQEYRAALSENIDLRVNNEFGPYLYPNQYIWFTSDYKVVDKAEALAQSADNDMEVVEAIYNYVIQNTSYDHDLAENVKSGYLPNVDTTLSTGKGICLDYSALMCSMLRSQGIPCRLEVGNAGTAYHAWISTYIDEIGWVSGIIYFDGEDWSLMDPTFASSTDPEKLKEYIGDGDNYTTKYIY